MLFCLDCLVESSIILHRMSVHDIQYLKSSERRPFVRQSILEYLQFPPNADQPDLVLGEAFVPGSDEKHFCQPTSVAVSEATGTFFVADGYRNSRILKYNRDGKLLKIISE